MTERPLFADERRAAKLLSMTLADFAKAKPHLPPPVQIVPGAERWRVADLEKLGGTTSGMDGAKW